MVDDEIGGSTVMVPDITLALKKFTKNARARDAGPQNLATTPLIEIIGPRRVRVLTTDWRELFSRFPILHLDRNAFQHRRAGV